jgi:protein-S-isoprenylcysteine O-methyltransferase Ste14
MGMQAFLDLCVVALAWIMIGSFAWSMKNHFVAGTFPLGARLVSVAFFVCALALTWTLAVAEQPISFLVAGLGFQAASCGLFWWAIRASRTARLRYVFDADKPASLVTEGPYERIRHPFYTSYILFWIGWSLASASPWAIAIVAYFAFAYTAAAREEEQNFARSPLAEDYTRYSAVTGRFLPRMR